MERDSRRAGEVVSSQALSAGITPFVAAWPTGPVADFAAELREHPRFDEELLEYARRVTASYDGRWLVNKLVVNKDGFRVLTRMVLLSCANSREPRNPITYAALRDSCAPHAIASPRGLKSLLMTFRVAGFLEEERATDDRRYRLLRPTPLLLATYSEVIATIVTLVDHLHQSDLATRLRSDPEYLARFVRSHATEFVNGEMIDDLFPELMALFERDCGYVIVFSAVVADAMKAPFKLGATARQFGVSPSHARGLLARAAAQNLLEYGPRGSYIRISERLRDLLRGWVSMKVAFFALHARAALDARK